MARPLGRKRQALWALSRFCWAVSSLNPLPRRTSLCLAAQLWNLHCLKGGFQFHAAVGSELSFATASRVWFGAKCAYRSVIAKLP